MNAASVLPANASPVDKYKQAFQEEAREILVELESTLLELNKHPDDSELVGKAFRGLHTIKGSGAMFGFEEVAAFTHNLENAFDGIRTGRLHVTPELIDLTLAALDQIKVMLNSRVDARVAGASSDGDIQDRLVKLISLDGHQLADSPPPPTIETSFDAHAEMTTWKIQFSPGPDLLRTGADPLLMLRELKQLGELRVVTDKLELPPIGELDPERCYLRWEMLLTSLAAREAIADVFLFVEDECELTISRSACGAGGIGTRSGSGA